MFDDDFVSDFDDHAEFGDGIGAEEAVAFGTGYAFYRHGQDRQTRQLLGGMDRLAERIEGSTSIPEEVEPQPINNLEHVNASTPEWDEYIGQEPLKKQIAIWIASAKKRGQRLPHTLLASGFPGVGKTTMARLIAEAMGSNIYEMVPPFKSEALVAAAQKLDDGDILFIDEIHKLAETGKRGAEFLLKMLEDGLIYTPEGEVVRLKDITVIGATTDRDMLPEPVVDRFKVKPYFQPYTVPELSAIAVAFARKHGALDDVDDDLAVDIAFACRSTPRIAEEMVMSAQAMSDALGQPPTAEELLGFLEVEPDGMTRTHVHYVTALFQYFKRETADGKVEYIVGEAAMQQILRETKQGIGRVERFLVERGLVDRTPRGRRLTPAGIARAEEFIAAGKGASDV